ncbi:FAD-linked oxidoreductase [Lachnellula willkommii]|uniref:FAD-linked oxidoreductase n=1 Tax=Lachnellula willkommii TaxID=215461 RepID=A0A559MGW8_9HELO|nr:FAD-linked oxidoreductase [Lachnellula willkommii]
MGSTNAPEIEQLKASLSESSTVVTPESDKYQESLKRWAATAEKPASIIVFPTSAGDVSKAILFSTANKLELAVSGGGHATSGSSSTDGGLCIDLSKMRRVTVDAEKKTVTAQGGALWADVDSELGKYGLAAVGGTVNHTGIGGLTLGGGYGFLTGQYGLVVDNLLEVEFVLADGRIVTASASQNADLFWAARGAGVNFGVATSFTYRAHEHQNPVWGGILIFPKEKLVEVINAANRIYEAGESRQVMLVGFVAPPPAHQPVVMVLTFFDGAEDEAKTFFDPLLSLEPLADMTGPMPYSSANSMLNESMPYGFRRRMKGSAFIAPLDTTFAASLFKDFEDFLQKVPSAVLSVLLLEYVPFKKVLEVPQTATSFANRGAYGNILFGPGWTDPAQDSACREWTKVMYSKTRAELLQRKTGGSDPVTLEGVGEYVNYDGLNSSADVLFGVNAPRLAELKKKYDPGNVFCKGTKLIA